jgi:fused signal recognition particle receptor
VGYGEIPRSSQSMDNSVIIAVVSVLVVALVLYLFRRRTPELPRVAPERPATRRDALPDSAAAVRKPPAPRAPLPEADAEAKAEEPSAPAAADAGDHHGAAPVEEPSEAPPLAAAGDAHERDVAAIRKGLANTRGGFIARLAKLFGNRPAIDDNLLEEIEEVLLTADIGVKTSERMLGKLREQMRSGQLSDPDSVWKTLRELAIDVLAVPATPIDLSHAPTVILIVGVNGAGKTTTIGKLAARYAANGTKVLLAAGDTFRAAAVLQLEVWGKRVGCPVVTGKEGADPGAVIFEAVKRAELEGYELVIADTAGRLHTKTPLMDELKKVDRTIQKALGGRRIDEILLVLDATTGQNAVQQMHMFREALQVSGVVLTKLDGTAKGGMILGIVDEHRVPVRFIGLGERVEDLREFDAKSFVEAMFAKPDGEILAA